MSKSKCWDENIIYTFFFEKNYFVWTRALTNGVNIDTIFSLNSGCSQGLCF